MDPNLQAALNELTKADATITQLQGALKAAEQTLGSMQQQLDQARANDETDEAEIRRLLAEVGRLKSIVTAGGKDLDGDPDPVSVKLGAYFNAEENLPSMVAVIDYHKSSFYRGAMSTEQTWTPEQQKAHNQYGCRTFSIAFMPDEGNTGTAFRSPDNIHRYLDSIPGDVDPKNVLLTFYQEHENDSLPKGLYQNGSETLSKIARDRGMLYGPIHSAMTNNGTDLGLWPDVWAMNEVDKELYDFWGINCYSPKFEDPTPRMDPIKNYADLLGLPVLIGELAAPNGTRQSEWAEKARAWVLDNAQWAGWMSSQIPGETDWRLTDAAAREWFGIK